MSSITHENTIPWRKIPGEVQEEAGELASYTKDTDREGSITFCKKKDKSRIFVGNNFEGDTDSTLALSCDVQFGKSDKIGSMHSHPSTADTVGVLPSPGDLYSNVGDTFDEKIPQIDCITSPDTPLIPCYTYKHIPTRKTVNQYQRAFEKSRSIHHTDAFFVDRVRKDFDIALFDKKSGNREDEPDPKKVIKAALGKSNKALREEVHVYKRGQFCEYVSDLMGQGHRDDVINECRAELRKRSLLGLIDY